MAGGTLLTVRPDGSLLRADPGVLTGTPFSDWRVPGVLPATLVGGGFLLTGWWTWRNHRYGRELSLFAGIGLIAFETAEVAWLGFQPLEAVFVMVGVVTVALAWRMAGEGKNWHELVKPRPVPKKILKILIPNGWWRLTSPMPATRPGVTEAGSPRPAALSGPSAVDCDSGELTVPG